MPRETQPSFRCWRQQRPRRNLIPMLPTRKAKDMFLDSDQLIQGGESRRSLPDAAWQPGRPDLNAVFRDQPRGRRHLQECGVHQFYRPRRSTSKHHRHF